MYGVPGRAHNVRYADIVVVPYQFGRSPCGKHKCNRRAQTVLASFVYRQAFSPRLQVLKLYPVTYGRRVSLCGQAVPLREDV